MDKNKIVKICNTIGLVSIILLIYWVLAFITITVFGLKIFRQNMTESFYLSIIGILALMFGALMINIMLNLTIISEHVSKTTNEIIKKSNRLKIFLFIISFPLLIGFLFFGDWRSTKKKENYLISSAQYLINQYPDKTKLLCDYKFDSLYINKTEEILNFLSKTDDKFPNISVIVNDSVDNSLVFLSIRRLEINYKTKKMDGKAEYIHSCSKEESEYLRNVFLNNETDPFFLSNDGRYELYYPVTIDNKKIVLYFAEYQRYGKIGS